MQNNQFQQFVQRQQQAWRQAAGAAWLQEQKRRQQLEREQFEQQQAAQQDQAAWPVSASPNGAGWQSPMQVDPAVALDLDKRTRKKARKLRGRMKIEGEARGIRYRMEHDKGNALYIWSFRVERYDAAGNRLPPVPVEMRGRSFHGFINEGDRVRVQGRGKGGVIKARKVRNLTTGARVEVKANDMPLLVKIFVYPVLWFYQVLSWLIFVGIAVGIVALIVSILASG